MTSQPNKLKWTVHPAAEQPIRSALSVMIIAMIAGALYQITGTLLYSTISSLILLVSLTPFFMPTRYELSEECVKIKRIGRTHTLNWCDIKTWNTGRNVVYLSPHKAQSLREKKAVLILCPNNHREVVDYIEKVR